MLANGDKREEGTKSSSNPKLKPGRCGWSEAGMQVLRTGKGKLNSPRCPTQTITAIPWWWRRAEA